MMLLDDAACGDEWNRSAEKGGLHLEKLALYDTAELMLDGGHSAGWAITDAAPDSTAMENTVAAGNWKAAVMVQNTGRSQPTAMAVAVGDETIPCTAARRALGGGK